ncbi:MAG: hypothetical protein GKC03_03290 [Methanomassiliicoccales archaeon]|nr:hypothetical protein [Methanomassiliicoccales archaeon]
MIAKRAICVLIMFSMLLATIIVASPSIQAHTESDPMVVDLIAGGGNPESAMIVGDVSVWNDQEFLYVQFNTDGDCYLVETHLAVNLTLGEIPQTKKGNPIPGHFEYKNESHDEFTQSYTYTIPLDEAWVPCETDVVIAAHAVVCCLSWKLGPELVINGDFESPVVDTPQQWDIYDSGTPGLGWDVEWFDGASSYGGWERPYPAHLELHGGVNGWLPNTGDQYAELDTDWDGPDSGLTNEPASVNISQDLSTGQYCQVGFSWSPRPGHSDNQIEVYWEDEPIFGLSGPGDSNTIWYDESVILFSPEDISTLAFVETGNADSLGMFLDSVSVRCFPCETAWGDGEDFEGKNWAMYFSYHIQEYEEIITFPETGNAYIGYEDWYNGDFDYNDFGMNFNVTEVYKGGELTQIDMTFEAVIYDSGGNSYINITRMLNGDYEVSVERTATAITLETPAGSYSGSGDVNVCLFDTGKYDWPQKNIGEFVWVNITVLEPGLNPMVPLSSPRVYSNEIVDLDPIWENYDPWIDPYEDLFPGYAAGDYHIDTIQTITSTSSQKNTGLIIPIGTEVPFILVVPFTDWTPPAEDHTITGPYPDFYDFYVDGDQTYYDWYMP